MGVRLRVRSSWTRRADAIEACFELEQPKIVIGRRAGADVQLPHPAVSGTHAVLTLEGPRVSLVDEASTNGTKVNGARIAPQRAKPLRDGDVVEIGGFTLHVALGVAAAGVSAHDTRALALQLLRDALDPAGDRLPPPQLMVLNGPSEGAVFALPPAPSSMVLGRGETCDLQLPDADASREHATLTRDHRGVRVRDLGSKNGLMVNGKPTREAPLRDRDEVQVGATVLVFEDPAAGALEAVVAAPEAAMTLPEPVLVAPTDEDPSTLPKALEPTGPGPDSEVRPEPTVEDVGALVATPLASPRPGAARSRSSADLVVYALAAVVLALSVAGLVWLLGVG